MQEDVKRDVSFFFSLSASSASLRFNQFSVLLWYAIGHMMNDDVEEERRC